MKNIDFDNFKPMMATISDKLWTKAIIGDYCITYFFVMV